MSTATVEVVRRHLVEHGADPNASEVASAMRTCGLVVTDASLAATVQALRRDAHGIGRLEPLLALPGVTDILVNGAKDVWVDGPSGLRQVSVQFSDESEVRRLAQRLAASVGRRLDDSSPYVDARLADGTRFHAVLGILADRGTCLSLRVPSRRSLSLADWVAGGLAPVAAEVLSQLVHIKAAFVISGGTGSGKTTLLATLLSLVPAQERLLIVEDSRELQPTHAHCLRLETRPANAEGKGVVTLADLVRQALRMRPDRLVLGEVRGAEICDLLTALNTGHEGGCATVHANSAVDVPARLAALAALGGMEQAALDAQVASGLQAVIHVRRGSDGQRRVTEIAVLQRNSQTTSVEALPALTFDPAGLVERGAGSGQLERLLSS